MSYLSTIPSIRDEHDDTADYVDGFNGHKGTGTIASAAEQAKEIDRGTTAFLSDITHRRPQHSSAVIEGIALALCHRALSDAGFTARWSIVDKSGETVWLDPTDTITVFESLDASAVSVSMSTDLELADVASGRDRVLSVLRTALQALDETNSSSPAAGFGRDLASILATSKVVAKAIGREGSALAAVAAAAQAELDREAAATTGDIWSVDVSNLAQCPVCHAPTDRTDLVCSAGHPSSAALRAAQDLDLLENAVDLDPAHRADFSPEIVIKAKGSPARVVELSDITVEQLVMAQRLEVRLSTASNDPWGTLSDTTAMKAELDAAMIARTGRSDSPSRAANAIRTAIEKVADQAANDIAAPIATQIARFIVEHEAAAASAAWKAMEDEYRADLRARALAVPTKDLKAFADSVNTRGRFTGRPNRNSGRRRGNTPRRHR